MKKRGVKNHGTTGKDSNGTGRQNSKNKQQRICCEFGFKAFRFRNVGLSRIGLSFKCGACILHLRRSCMVPKDAWGSLY